MKRSSTAVSPSATHDTDPSGSFLTHPVTAPASPAARQVAALKPTPCTRPRNTTRMRWMDMFVGLLAAVRDVPAGARP